MNILVTGSRGQLGSEIKGLAANYKDFNFFFRDLPALDICNKDQLDFFLIENNIHTVINCAAYTAVDKAEENVELATSVNSTGVSNLVNALEKNNGKIIHISTDYVFDGNNSQPYKESDLVSPIGIYGRTKRAGELAVIDGNIDGIVLRTSWLYSSFGSNFVKTMLRLGNEKESLKVIFDQKGTPTYARDLAKTCLDILSSESSAHISKNGNLYHYSNEGVTSWYDFAAAIMELGKIKCKLTPIQTKDYITLAKRPKYSVLDKSKIKSDFKLTIPHWRDSLFNCIKKINFNS